MTHYSSCNAALAVFGFGMSSHETAVATYKPTKMGCKTDTPTRVARTPVTIGKADPPIWPITNTSASAVEWMRGGNSLDPTEMPCVVVNT